MSTRPLRRRLSEASIALLSAVLVVAGTVQAVRGDDGEDGDGTLTAASSPPVPTTATGTTGTTAPATPRPAAAPPAAPVDVYGSLVSFVVRTRGLAFTTPVRPQYVTPAAFDAALVRIGRKRAPSQRVRTDAASNARTATLLALGIARSRNEVVQYHRTAGTHDNLRAAYDPRTGRLLVRGLTLTPFVQQSIVRELTRVLQRQRFPHPSPRGEEAIRAYAALSAGDAGRVARAWYDAQTPAVQSAVDREDTKLYGDATGSPDALSVYDSYPDVAGQALVQRLLQLGGQARLDAAFRTPPTTTAQVRDPRLAAPSGVERPATPRGGRAVEIGTLGELGLAILLQEYPTAPSAARGWRGDRYLTYLTPSQYCTVVHVRIGSAAQQRALLAAARRVVRTAQPIGTVGVALQGCKNR